MANTTTLNETTRSPLDGTEYLRLATTGANWKATLASIFGTSAITTNIVGVGTLLAGSTGAGFTVALGTSTITGALPAANFPALTGAVTNSAGSLATTLNPISTIATSLAIGGATIGTNALAVTGTVALSSTVSATQYTSTIATGTAPFVVASTTNVANLNASSLGGATFAAPGAIGGTTPAAITGTTITAAAASGFNLGAVSTLVLSAGYHFLNSPSGGGAIILGPTGDKTNYYRQDSHILQSISQTTYATLDGTSLAIALTTDATSVSTGAIRNPGGMSVNKRVWMNGITTSAGLQTAVLCQSSAGEVIADSVACLASSERFKRLLGMSEKGALDKIIRIPVRKWEYEREPDSVFADNYYAERIGPTAEDIAAIDSRLVGRDKQGRARSISPDQLLALAIQAIQEQQEQIEGLKMRLAA